MISVYLLKHQESFTVGITADCKQVLATSRPLVIAPFEDFQQASEVQHKLIACESVPAAIHTLTHLFIQYTGNRQYA